MQLNLHFAKCCHFRVIAVSLDETGLYCGSERRGVKGAFGVIPKV
jgi:hypothetical protein